MEWQGWFSLALTIAVLVILAVSRVSAHLVLMGALVILSVSGIITAPEALAGFANEGVITVAAMFVVAAGIQASGGVDLLVERLGQPKTARQAQARIVVPVTAASAFLNNTPLVATMIPAVHALAKKIDVAPSKLMIPLSYAAVLGGTITLIGTSTNLVVNGQYQALTGNPGFSLFAITPVGLPVAVVGVLFMLWWFPRALPNYRSEPLLDKMREFTLEVAVATNGPLVGKTVQQAGLRSLKRVFLVEIERKGHILTAVTPEEILEGGDRLVFAGDTEAISDLLCINGLVPSTHDGEPLLTGHESERRLVEAVISPHSDCLGETIRESNFRARYGAVVLAVARNGERVAGNLGSIQLQAGDTLLLEARPAFVSRQRYNREFLLINDLDREPPRHQRAYTAWGILLGIILLASFEITSMFNAALLGAAAMILSGCCSAGQAQKSLDIGVIVTIAASFALGAALKSTGVTTVIAENVVTLSGGEAWLILVLTYITICLLSEVISNNAAAVLMLPIVLDMIEQANLNPEPFIFAIMMAASASFATPIGYQTHLMVQGPGNYRFSDFVKVGIPMDIVIGVTSVIVICLIYPLRG
ncbi:MAG: SLC13 family permease [Pseudomonadota bacterium]